MHTEDREEAIISEGKQRRPSTLSPSSPGGTSKHTVGFWDSPQECTHSRPVGFGILAVVGPLLIDFRPLSRSTSTRINMHVPDTTAVKV